MTERTDTDVLSASPVVVILGGREFSLSPITKGRSRKFCAEFAALLNDASMFAGIIEQIQMSGIASLDIAAIIPAIQKIAGTSLHNFVDLIYLYNTELDSQREFIEESATLEECIAAIGVIFGLAFGPFGRIPSMLTAMNPKTTAAKPSLHLTESTPTQS